MKSHKFLLMLSILLSSNIIYGHSITPQSHLPYISLPHLCSLPVHVEFEDVAKKVVPTITYAKLLEDINGYRKNEVVEVLADVGKGTHYQVQSPTLCTWIPRYSFEFLPYNNVDVEPLNSYELELFVNNSDFSSETFYFIWVDLARQMVYIFFGDEGNWSLHKQFICSTGKQETSTVRGIFYIKERGEELRTTEYAKYWVKFQNNYLFHSTPLDENGNVADPTLGKPASAGCVRLHLNDALWFYENIPKYSTVWVN
ncbi:MAG: hypothetical protein ATN36_04195 [Epulopiscium sp. Nele67-Bin005]|nr:MAG: hypothetical protein ATN36_04195 [Epulopiscium sp. Nele67-Bin005]